jgi:G3E family GTPase
MAQTGQTLMALIPATILTGFLGSGKTTLLKRVLSEAHGQKIAVIENEFGEENIDNEILVADTNEQIIQMSNGCICCTIREDLRTTLRDLAEKKRKGELDFDRIVIETTGLADPGPVAQTFFMDDEIAEQYLLDSILTLWMPNMPPSSSMIARKRVAKWVSLIKFSSVKAIWLLKMRWLR